MRLLSNTRAAESFCEGLAASFLDPTGLGLTAALIKVGFSFVKGPSFEQRLKVLEHGVAKALPKGQEYEEAEVFFVRSLVQHEVPQATKLFELGEEPSRITDYLLQRRAS
ncbi:MAG: hypothetical protein AAF809_14035 [Bacteroidota bacterium]